MKGYVDYIDDACKALDRWSGSVYSAKPTQLQTINLALVMAIADLIAAVEGQKK